MQISTDPIYRDHHAERRVGFRHGPGVLRRRQDWSVGEIVNVGFVRGLMVVRLGTKTTPTLLVSAKGVSYEFEPHCGLTRVGG